MRKVLRMLGRSMLVLVGVLVFASLAIAQSAFPPPSGPVAICGTVQASPYVTPTTWQMVFTPPGGPAGSPEAITVSAPTGCPGGATHRFDIPATRFTIGQHFVQVVTSSTTGGTAQGNTWSITVNVTGAFTITAVLPPPE